MRGLITSVRVIITLIGNFVCVCSGIGVSTNSAFGVKIPLHCWLQMVPHTNYKMLQCVPVIVVTVVFLCRLATALQRDVSVHHTVHVDLT